MPSKPIVSQLNIRAEATRIKGLANFATLGSLVEALRINADALVSIQEAVDTIVQRQRDFQARMDAAGL